MAKQQRILVVDDSATIRTTIRKELEAGGYLVDEAADGISALAKATGQETPDCITLDVEMPRLDGFATCRKLREPRYARFFAHHPGGQVPVIFVTGLDNLDGRVKGFQLGATDFIAKPFNRGEILSAVDRVLRPESIYQHMTALVVDDSLLIRNIVGQCLQKFGLTVLEAADGREAMALLGGHTSSIDIVITDFNMPEVNGDQLCRHLRSELGMRHVPVLFLTAADEQDTIIDLFKAGATDYVTKPFVQEELEARVRVHLEARKLFSQLFDEVRTRKKAEEELLAQAGELQRLNEKLQDQAVKDGLTGLYNHRHFQEELQRAFGLARRHGQELSCILTDLDHFKQVNDTFGHPFGDFVLKGFSKILQKMARKTDTVARYGGEEFVLLLPNTSVQGAMILADRIRKSAGDHLYDDGTNSRKVTASMGIASLKANAPQEARDLLEFADQALYRSKKEGRNRVTLYEAGNGQDPD